MDKDRLRLLAIAAAVALAVGGVSACGDDDDDGGSGGSESGEPLVVGAALALTGEFAPFDIPSRQGMEYAVEQINAEGGVDGHPIELNVKDVKSEAKLAGVVAQELLDDGAQVMVAIPWPEVNAPILNADAQADVATVIPLNTTPYASLEGAGTVVFTNFSDAAQCAAIAEFALEQGESTAVTVSSPDHPYTQNNPQYFEEAFTAGGGEVVGDVQFTIGQTEFDSVAQKVADLNPDMVFTSMFIPDTPVFLKALRAAGFDGAVYGNDGFDSPALTKVAGDAAEDVYFSVGAFPEPGGELEAMMDGIEKSQGELPESAAFAGQGYDGIQQIKAAVEKAGSIEASEITAAFDDLGTIPDTVTGEIILEGHNEFPTKTVTIVAVEDGELTLADQIIPENVPEA